MRVLAKTFAGIVMLIQVAVASAADMRILARDSVEYLVADSDVVVVGRVVEARLWRSVTEARRPKGLSGASGDITFERIEIEADEVLKGTVARRFSALVPNSGAMPAGRLWPQRGKMIICLVNADRWKRDDLPCSLVVRWRDWWAAGDQEGWDHHSAFALGQPVRSLRKLDLSPVGGAHDLEVAIRKVLAEDPGPGQPYDEDVDASSIPLSARAVSIWLPQWDLEIKDTRQDAVVLAPCNRLLERQAQIWASSPWPQLRANAINAYEQMRSSRSEASLKEMLAAEEYFVWYTHNSDAIRIDRWTPRIHPLRGEIHRILREWGIDWPVRPELEPRVAYRSLWSAWMLGLIAGLVGVFAFRPLRRCILKIRLSTIVIVILMLMWARSHWYADELVFNLGGSEHEFVSYRGGVQYAWTADWRHGKGWRIGSGRIDTRLPRGVPDLEQHARGPANFTPWDPEVFAHPVSAGTTAFRPVPMRTPTINVLWQRCGVAIARSDRIDAPFNPYRQQNPLTGPVALCRAHLVQVPYWLLVALAGVPVIGRIRRWRRRKERRWWGLCEECGYDLRASVGRCPECGHGMPVLGDGA